MEGSETELFHEDNNHQSRRVATMTAPTRVTSIAVEVLALNGDSNVEGGIFEVRAYNS